MPSRQEIEHSVVTNTSRLVAVAAGRRVGKTTMIANIANGFDGKILVVTPYENQLEVLKHGIKKGIDETRFLDVIFTVPENLRRSIIGYRADLVLVDEADWLNRDCLRWIIEDVNSFKKVIFFGTINSFEARFELKRGDNNVPYFMLEPVSNIFKLATQYGAPLYILPSLDYLDNVDSLVDNVAMMGEDIAMREMLITRKELDSIMRKDDKGRKIYIPLDFGYPPPLEKKRVETGLGYVSPRNFKSHDELERSHQVQWYYEQEQKERENNGL
jgi:hypothetical protein